MFSLVFKANCSSFRIYKRLGLGGGRDVFV